jgi:hypothetical protein
MAVVIKSKGLQLLTKLGIEPTLVEALKAKGVTLAVSHKSFTFYAVDNKILVCNELPVSATDLLGSGVSYFNKKTGKEILTSAAQSVLTALLAETETQPVAESPVQAAALEQATTVLTTIVAPADFNQVVPLREATKMYQKVRGTSSGSVYIVVALNDSLRVAARIIGTNLAVRVEPAGSNSFHPVDINRLKAQSLDYKQTYASGHFECGKVSAARTLGAILVGLGIVFDTPLPSVELVVAASKK